MTQDTTNEPYDTAAMSLHPLASNVGTLVSVQSAMSPPEIDALVEMINRGIADLLHEARKDTDRVRAELELYKHRLAESDEIHLAAMTAIDDKWEYRLDQANRATVAAVLETLDTKSVTLDLGLLQTVWHRNQLSMQLNNYTDEGRIVVKYERDTTVFAVDTMGDQL